MQKDDDGRYYWTVKTGASDPVWLLDADKHKIPATGDLAPKPEISVDTDDDGLLCWKVDGEWLLDAGRKHVPAAGPQDPAGPQGDAVFAAGGVDLTNPAFVTFTLADGKTTFTVPRSAPLTMGKEGVILYPESLDSYDVTVTLPTGFADKDYVSIMAEVKGSFGTSTDVQTRADGSSAGWKVSVAAPTFQGERGQAVVTLTAPRTADGQVVDDAPVWLEVTLLDSKGMKYTATCVVKVGNTVSTAVELIKALMSAGGTADKPMRIVLANDLTMSAAEVNEATGTGDSYFFVQGCKVLDGTGFTLTNDIAGKGRHYSARIWDAGVSLEITNLTIKDADVRKSNLFNVRNKCRLTLGKGVSVVTKGRDSNSLSPPTSR